eukprot:augustus_masked-scaffold_41-processed-gene-2.7-mRNA-1 protein AED:0.53 eAED:0.54 QI:0/-1/0/1/-1/1/1/0/343
MFLAFNLSTNKLVKARDGKWDEEGTIQKSIDNFHKNSKKVNEVCAPDQNITSIYDSELSETEGESCEASSEAEDEAEVLYTSDKENGIHHTLFYPFRFDDISTQNIVNGKRTRKMVINRLQVTEQHKPPRKFEQIREREDREAWINVYRKEIDALETVGNFEVVNRPNTGDVIIPFLELFSTKKDIYGNHIARVRIVVKGGYSKLIIPDTAVVFSPVASVISTRIFLGGALKMETKIKQLDVTAAFIYGKLPEGVLLELPRGHRLREGNKKVWKTTTSIYGLSESPLIWFRRISEVLRTLSIVSLINDRCVFIKWKGRSDEVDLIALLYVEDLLFAEKNQEVE